LVSVLITKSQNGYIKSTFSFSQTLFWGSQLFVGCSLPRKLGLLRALHSILILQHALKYLLCQRFRAFKVMGYR